MKCKTPLTIIVLFSFLLSPPVAYTHTISWGFENAGPGAITVWAGSYHDPSELPTNQGNVLLTPQGGGAGISAPFNIATGVKPAGLIDGVTNFYAGGLTLISVDQVATVNSWQGAHVVGLAPGYYTIQYDPAFTIPSTKWRPWDRSIQGGNVVFISAAVVGVVVVEHVDGEVIFSTVNSSLPMAVAQREVVLSGIETSLRDVDGRLFRLRSRTDDEDPAMPAVGERLVSYDDKGKTQVNQELAPQPRRFEVFASGDYGNTDRENIAETPGFTEDVYAGTVGIELRLTKLFTAGFAATILDSQSHLGRGLGDVDLSGFSLSPYLSFFWKNFYADALYSFGRFEHDIHRDTIFGATAKADPDSNNHVLQFNIGYNFRLSGFVTGPFAGVNYTTGEVSGYTENNAGRFNTHVDGQNYNSIRTEIGWQVSYPIHTSFGGITPQLRASWWHEESNGDESVSASLVQSPFVLTDATGSHRIGSFSTSGDTHAPGRDALTVGGGISADFGSRFTLLADYQIDLLQSNNLQQFVSIRASLGL